MYCIIAAEGNAENWYQGWCYRAERAGSRGAFSCTAAIVGVAAIAGMIRTIHIYHHGGGRGGVVRHRFKTRHGALERGNCEKQGQNDLQEFV